MVFSSKSLKKQVIVETKLNQKNSS